MESQIRLKKKREKILYLEAKKQQRKYLLKYLEVSKQKKGYDWCFKGQNEAWEVNVIFLAVINKEIGSSWSVFRV